MGITINFRRIMEMILKEKPKMRLATLYLR